MPGGKWKVFDSYNLHLSYQSGEINTILHGLFDPRMDEIVRTALESISVHVSLAASYPTSAEERSTDKLEKAMMEDSRLSALGEFTGNLVGGGEVVYYFETKTPGVFLERARDILFENDFLLQSYALVGDGIANSETRIDLDHFVDGSSIRKRKHGHPCRAGNYYAIPLEGGMWGYAQYLKKERPWGDFLQVLDVKTDGNLMTAEQLCKTPPMFPPILTSVAHCVRFGNWKYVGRPKSYTPPGLPPFRGSTAADCAGRAPGVYTDWAISWPDQDRVEFVGILNGEQQRLEMFRGWFLNEIVQRITTGFNPDSKAL